MHKRNILHRDLKSENILCNSHGDVKIGDLGLSTFLTAEETFSKCIKGSAQFFAPEVAKGGGNYGSEVDVW